MSLLLAGIRIISGTISVIPIALCQHYHHNQHHRISTISTISMSTLWSVGLIVTKFLLASSWSAYRAQHFTLVCVYIAIRFIGPYVAMWPFLNAIFTPSDHCTSICITYDDFRIMRVSWNRAFTTGGLGVRSDYRILYIFWNVNLKTSK